jgi:hypothetical protein
MSFYFLAFVRPDSPKAIHFQLSIGVLRPPQWAASSLKHAQDFPELADRLLQLLEPLVVHARGNLKPVTREIDADLILVLLPRGVSVAVTLAFVAAARALTALGLSAGAGFGFGGATTSTSAIGIPVMLPTTRRWEPSSETHSTGRGCGNLAIPVDVRRATIMGATDTTKISTSYVERQNLSLRMACRRFTRLTNAFSKKLANHRAAVALYVAHYNLCRVHEALRITPAMAIGVTDHVWTIGELVEAALGQQPDAPAPVVPPRARRRAHSPPTGRASEVPRNRRWKALSTSLVRRPTARCLTKV